MRIINKKFIINRDQFSKSLTNVTKIIQNKSVNPILSNVKIDLNETGLVLIGSNGDISITTKIPLFINDRQIIRDISYGSTLVNAFLLTEIVKRIDGDEISFEIVDDSIAKIETEKSNFKLNSVRSEEYLDIDFSKEGAKITLSSQDFIDSINQVSFAASVKDTRPSLTAVNLESDTSKLIFTATDGARLAKKELNIQIQERLNANIPSKTLNEVLRSITTEQFIEIYISDKKALFVLNNTIISSRLINGEYPNTKNIIPRSFYYLLEINASEFVSAMERVSLFSIEKDSVVKLTMNEEKVEVSSKSQQVGSAVETISNFRYKGERLEISFNSEYVKSAIRSLKGTDVLLSFLGEMKPFTVTDKNDDSIVQLITPVRPY